MLSDKALADLEKSALPADYATTVLQMYMHPQENGYVIPYFHIDGTKLGNYVRTKLLERKHEPRYVSPSGLGNHIYIPPDFLFNFNQHNRQFIMVTEGEKKAASASYQGLPCIGFPGVNSWRSGTHRVRKDAVEVTDDGDGYILKIDSEATFRLLDERVAPELFGELLHLLQQTRAKVFMCFDRDPQSKPESIENVALAQFEFAFWLTQQGVEETKSILLPNLPPPRQLEKVGLDDFIAALTTAGRDPKGALLKLVTDSRFHSYPKPVNVMQWVQKQLDKKAMQRQDKLKLVRALLAALDSKGQRYYDQSGIFHYFDQEVKELYSFRFETNELRQFRLSSFGQYLGRHYGVGSSDVDVLNRFADLYAATNAQPITPRRCSYAASDGVNDALYIQLSDSRVAKVTQDAITLEDNGIDGQLFLAGKVKAVNEEALRAALASPDPNHRTWPETLAETTLQAIDGLTIEQTRLLIGCLFYLSPWFRRWRNLMLPIELAVAEPGSGKTFLYNLRTGILSGSTSSGASLPHDFRDWYSSVGNGGDLWFCDNASLMPRELRTQLSDELCRLVTSNVPSVEMRKLYTTASLEKVSMDAAFAFTAVQNPFQAEDLLQRSLVMRFEAIKEGTSDARWVERQLEHGGRERWLAHMLLTAQQFIRHVGTGWNNNYHSNHRLAGFEQSLLCMSRALDREREMVGIIAKLGGITLKNIEESSPVLQALKEFASNYPAGTEFPIRAICDWITMNAGFDYGNIQMLQSPIGLSRHLSAHAADIYRATGIRKTNHQVKGKAQYIIDASPSEALESDK